MVISLLADHPEYIGDLAPEIARHWSAYLPQESVSSRTAKLTAHCNRDKLPVAWVAFDSRGALGTAALRVHDLAGREDLSPWLAGVFVKREFRGHGIACALCEVAEAYAWRLGFKRLYLFTIDHESMYTRLGWRAFGRGTWMGVESSIMVKDSHAA